MRRHVHSCRPSLPAAHPPLHGGQPRSRRHRTGSSAGAEKVGRGTCGTDLTTPTLHPPAQLKPQLKPAWKAAALSTMNSPASCLACTYGTLYCRRSLGEIMMSCGQGENEGRAGQALRQPR